MTEERLAWLRDRILGIGASDASAAMGLSKYKSRYQLWLEKTGQVEAPNLDDVIPVQVGSLLEPLVISIAERELGEKIIDRQQVLVSEAYSWMRCTLDGRINEFELVEAKTAGSRNGWGESGTDQIPMDYIIQCHHQMIITGAHTVHVPVIFGGREFDMYAVPFDDGLAEHIIEMERDFWHMVENRIQPEMDTLSDVEIAYRSATADKTLIPTPMVEDAVRQLRFLKSEAKGLEEQIEKQELIIKSYMQDAEYIKGLCSWKQQQRKSLDTKALKSAHPALYSEFERTSEFRVLRLSKGE